MRHLTATLISLSLLVSAAFGQGFMGAPSTPAGTSFAESFGDVGGPCGFGSYVGCNQPWTAGAGSPAIIASPFSGPPWCGHSLQVNQAAAAQYLYAPLTNAIPAGATADVYIAIDFLSAFPGSGNTILTLGSVANGQSNYVFQIAPSTTSSIALTGNGSVYSSNVAVSENTAYTLHIHLASGTNASYFQLNGGAETTFTEGANAANFITFGAAFAQTVEYDVGAIWISAPGSPNCAQNIYPQALVNFEGGTAGNLIAAADLAASTIGGNGAWTVGTNTQMTYAAAGQLSNFHTPPDICGTYQSGSGSLGLQYATGTTGQDVAYTPVEINSTAISMSLFYETNMLATDSTQHDFAELRGTSSGDFLTVTELGSGTSLQIQVENHDGVDHLVTAISPNHVYWITLQYEETGNHQVCVYDASTWSQLACLTRPAVGGIAPSQFIFGNPGSEPQTSGYDYWIDDVVMDYGSGELRAP